MTRLSHVEPESLGPMANQLAAVEKAMGFTPNSFLTMGHWPELLKSFAGFAGGILAGGTLERSLKQLIAFVASQSAGCRYCQAHTSHGAEVAGVSHEKLAAVYEFETADAFDERERAALRVASRGAMVPNAVEAEDFVALKAHFSEKEIVEIVAVVSLFGFLNRWNDTMATTLEGVPTAFANENLASHGWELGKHAG